MWPLAAGRPVGVCPVVKRQLQEGQIKPAVELGAHLRQQAHLHEAQLFMQADRAGIACLDPGHHHMLADDPCAGDQALHQRAADTCAALVRPDMDRMLDRMAIAVKGAPVPERGIAQHRAILVYGHQNRIPGPAPIRVPGPAVVKIDQGVVPDRRRMFDSIVVDRRDPLKVTVLGIANVHGLPCCGADAGADP